MQYLKLQVLDHLFHGRYLENENSFFLQQKTLQALNKVSYNLGSANYFHANISRTQRALHFFLAPENEHKIVLQPTLKFRNYGSQLHKSHFFSGERLENIKTTRL